VEVGWCLEQQQQQLFPCFQLDYLPLQFLLPLHPRIRDSNCAGSKNDVCFLNRLPKKYLVSNSVVERGSQPFGVNTLNIVVPLDAIEVPLFPRTFFHCA
jgi:hypothetical protein